MKTSIDEVARNKVKLTVEVPADEVGKLLSRTYKRLAGEIKVPGFRPGKAPKAIIDQRLGKDFVRSEALKEGLPGFYAEAVEASSLDVVAPPEIDVKTFEDGQDLTFEAVVETRPTPELKEYFGLEASKPSAEVTDADVDEQLERLRVRFATLEVVNRPLKEGDFALIDLTTYRHDETIDELTAKDLLIEVGAEMVVPELDRELEGKRKGDILKITATLPERFGERAGWQVGLRILVKEGKARKLPALDDDLAKTVSEFDTLDELRHDLRERLVEAKEAAATARLRENVLDAFADHGVEVELPDGMVEFEIDGLLQSFARILAAQGIPLDRFMESESLDPQGLRDRFRDQARRNLTVRLGLDMVAHTEGLEVQPSDREEEAERLAQRTGNTVEDVMEALNEGQGWKSVDGDILRSKALDLLVERARITVTTEEGSASESA